MSKPNMKPSESESEVEPIICPFRVAIDTREQAPYEFLGLRANADKKYAPILVGHDRVNLPTGKGDYSIVGLSKIALERKSKADLYSSIASGRDNFESRLLRMQAFAGNWYSAIIVEAEISELVNDPPPHTQYSPKSLIRTIGAWDMRYPAVKWFFLPGRQAAEAWTFRTLERFWHLFHGRIPALNELESTGKFLIGDPNEVRDIADTGRNPSEIYTPAGISLVALELD